MIVVDTNVVAYLYLESEFTARAEAQLRLDPDWGAPVLWRSEFRNILAGAIRRKMLGLDAARQVLAEGESPLAGGEHEVGSQHVLELVRDSDCSGYDCEFVALATQLNVKLVTIDGKLLKTFPKLAASFPDGCARELLGCDGVSSALGSGMAPYRDRSSFAREAHGHLQRVAP